MLCECSETHSQSNTNATHAKTVEKPQALNVNVTVYSQMVLAALGLATRRHKTPIFSLTVIIKSYATWNT